jgi:hypothetical protein
MVVARALMVVVGGGKGLAKGEGEGQITRSNVLLFLLCGLLLQKQCSSGPKEEEKGEGNGWSLLLGLVMVMWC